MIIFGSVNSLLLIGVVCVRGMPESYGAQCFHSLGLLGLCLVV